ncbi:hypothetical protein HQ529_03600 [Candidatus Woesearchaeota archaeon]|nr:hypothetical protein [Candidatus Woesearchaeota archaeon]
MNPEGLPQGKVGKLQRNTTDDCKHKWMACLDVKNTPFFMCIRCEKTIINLEDFENQIRKHERKKVADEMQKLKEDVKHFREALKLANNLIGYLKDKCGD